MIAPLDQIKELLKGETDELVIAQEPPAVGSEEWVRIRIRARPVSRVRVLDSWPYKAGGHVVRVEVIPDPFQLPEKAKRPSPSLRLTREQRAKIFDGDMPYIAGQGDCPVQEGIIVKLSSRLQIRITRVLTVPLGRGGGWELRYELQDTRDNVRNLRRTPGISDESFGAIRASFDEFGYPPELNADVEALAAAESAYTSAATSLADAGEGVDAATLDRFVAEAKTKAGRGAELNQLRRERHEVEQRLLRARADAQLLGVDISSPLRVIERQLAKIERRVYEGKAA